MAVDLTPLQNSLVRVLGLDGFYAGLGYRIATDLVITCAHVVAAAMDTHGAEVEASTVRIMLDVPFATEGEDIVQAPAQVVPGGWLPMRDDKGPSDLALLRVSDGPHSLPLPGSLADLDPALSLTDRVFHAYGGPMGHERHPVHHRGEVRALLGNGRWQLAGRDSEYPIEPGWSGTPAVDDRSGRVIGLIAQDEQDPDVPAAFLIPAAHLRKLLVAAGFSPPFAPGLESLRQWLDAHLRGSYLADSVRRFVDSYMGDPDRPMPYAGREDELAALDERLASAHGGLVLVSGSAGLGKSALLLHWMARRLRRTPDLHLLFLPVSIRFNTAGELSGLRLLHSQLVGLFAEVAFPEGAKPDLDDYRDRIADGWEAIAKRSGERFLLVVDGADEASGLWLTKQVLPYIIPCNLTVVLAARHKPGHEDGRAWLADFAVASECPIAAPVELGPLKREAVGDVMAQLGPPLDALRDRKGVLDAFYRLTDHGDPLLVNLWIGQLWQDREQIATLSSAEFDRLHPGYRGFVDNWLEDQEKVWKLAGIEAHADDLRRMLRVLALAREPLLLRDWLYLTKRLPVLIRCDFMLARKLLDNAHRLVVGDAEEQGYTFVHPRLADHFRDELMSIKAERLAVPQAFLDWGASIVSALNEGRLAPAQCPAYLLHHYTAHVLAANLPSDEALDKHLLALLKEGWRGAWEEEEGAYSGYLVDLRRVQETLREVDNTRKGPRYRLAAELRCALIRASIRSLTANLRPELIASLAEAGVWTAVRAARIAEELPDPEERIRTLADIGSQTWGDTRRKILERALAVVRGTRDEESRARFLVLVAEQLAGETRLLDEALTTARSIANDCDRSYALVAVVDQMDGESVLLGKALEAARDIGDVLCRIDVLAVVAGNPSTEKRLLVMAEALKEARGIFDAESRAYALAAIAENLAQGERVQVLREALTAARGIANEPQRDEAVASVAELSAEEAILCGETMAAVRCIRSDRSRAEVLANLAEPLAGEARSQVLEEALKAAESIDPEDSRAEALAAVAARLGGDEGLLGQVLDAVRRIGSGKTRADVLMVVAEQVTGEALLLREALETARGIDDKPFRAHTLAAVAEKLPQEDRSRVLAEALAAARDIGGKARAWGPRLFPQAGLEESRTYALAAVAEKLGGDERSRVLKESLEGARGIVDAQGRAEALVSVTDHMVGSARSQALKESLEAARGIVDAQGRAKTLASVAEHMAGSERSQVLGEALTAARRIGDEGPRAHALAAVAGALENEGRSQVLEEALKAIRAIADVWERACALEAVAVRLAGEKQLVSQVVESARSMDYEYRAFVDLSRGDRYEWSVASSLVAAATLLAGEERRQVLGEALEAARKPLFSNGSSISHVRALVAVAEQLPGEEQRQVLGEALQAARGARLCTSDRVQALVAVAEQLPGEERQQVLGEALQMARSTKTNCWPPRSVQALLAVAEQLPRKERLQVLGDALRSARAAASDGERAEDLADVAEHLTGVERSQVLAEALETARSIDSAWDYVINRRSHALVAVAKNLAGRERLQVLGEALEADHGTDHAGSSPDVLNAVAYHLIEADWVRRPLDARSEGDPAPDRAKTLAPFTLKWSHRRYCLFASLLDAASDFDRKSLLVMFGALAPAIAALGGEAALRETADAIRDTVRWWP